ncbi:Major membrane immunogen%2C membrane-anchored lipoprotein [uncultured Roseburia sp.]|uniref:Uncharacterized protein n=1 Tax=Brotonthovivens ammoniilytica TaxID=2981725 RepID=A0ABT2TI29_9FIRM|nr:hypothetical protein [Brotonthovivens ammoniilytica]MCU6761835.1 hypothetical protein [Brotonthovivens ammoniilytica]SCI48061.1 Major membrane immunogen%2C membrane-anchored lipoprotein [uncultured Roseburia sp.]
MKRIKVLILVSALSAVWLMGGCGNEKKDTAGSLSQQQDEAKDTENSQVASSKDMAKKQDVGTADMKAVKASQLKEGEYEIAVDSSSSMFKITSCTLTVKDGKMKAVMTMSGTGYLKLFMGTGEEAVNASEEEFIPFKENSEGIHSFEVPVEALDQKLDCAAFSKNKEKWYDRELVFRADSLPTEAFTEGALTTAESLNLKDGSYTGNVKLEGGSGRASVESPAQLQVKDGKVTAKIVWSSSNYDYMKVDGEKFEQINTEGNSAFEIPVSCFDRKIAVIADTIAMSEPHEIDYTLTFDSESLKKAE